MKKTLKNHKNYNKITPKQNDPQQRIYTTSEGQLRKPALKNISDEHANRIAAFRLHAIENPLSAKLLGETSIKPWVVVWHSEVHCSCLVFVFLLV